MARCGGYWMPLPFCRSVFNFRRPCTFGDFLTRSEGSRSASRSESNAARGAVEATVEVASVEVTPFPPLVSAASCAISRRLLFYFRRPHPNRLRPTVSKLAFTADAFHPTLLTWSSYAGVAVLLLLSPQPAAFAAIHGRCAAVPSHTPSLLSPPFISLERRKQLFREAAASRES